MKVKMGVLPNLKDTGNIVLMGVIVESSGTKKTTNNKEYMVWQLSDLLVSIVLSYVDLGLYPILPHSERHRDQIVSFQ